MTERLYEICNWYALYTRSRHEKFVETWLLRKGIEAFTPKVTLRRKWSDRIKSIEEPVFKSYCFAKFPLRDRIPILSQEGVVTIVHFNDKFVPVEESVISSLKILTENELKIDPYPYLREGARVIVKRGPLKGLEGFMVEKRNGNTTVVISVDAIMSSVKCVLDAGYVELAA